MVAPIQVILNPENYEEARDAGGGGPKKDFFAGRDAAFRLHKQSLIHQLRNISNAIDAQTQGRIGVIKVVLRREAWAKSHRPFRALFRPDRVALVGGGDIGELFFEVNRNILDTVSRDITRAEEITRLKFDEKLGRDIPHPSTLKSETGAIDRIEIYGPNDRRSFSVEEAVSWLANPMTGNSYQVEMFEVPPPRNRWDAVGAERRQLYASFVEGLARIGSGLSVQRLPTGEKERLQLEMRLARSSEPAKVQLIFQSAFDRKRSRDLVEFDPDIRRHRSLLSFLENHPLVRRIDLPPIITRTVNERSASVSVEMERRARPQRVIFPDRDAVRTYPKFGIIDGGVGGPLTDWIVDRWDVLNDTDINLDHGTFIGGLAIAGRSVNGSLTCPEPDGIDIVDVAVLPTSDNPQAFASYYPDGINQFFDEIEFAVADFRARRNVRVFNMSLNIQYAAEPNHYGAYAKRLDDLADAHNAIFVISAGNIAPQNLRAEWPRDEAQALGAVAAARNDAMLMPAESVRNISVAALNPPGMSNVVPFAPARYSRRGPGLRTGVKPDLAHVGGSGSPQSSLGHGLFSVDPNGHLCDGCGTSYAAPLVAKTAAVLEHLIEGEVSRETLIALLLHHARLPPVLTSSTFKAIARDLAGFGMPPSAQEIIQGSDNQITLVFATRI